MSLYIKLYLISFYKTIINVLFMKGSDKIMSLDSPDSIINHCLFAILQYVFSITQKNAWVLR